MRRTAAGTALTLLVATLELAVASPAPALVLPPAFQLVDYPTGQAPDNLTDFAWLEDGGLLTSGKDGTHHLRPARRHPAGGRPRCRPCAPWATTACSGSRSANDYATTGRVYLTYDKGSVGRHRLRHGGGVDGLPAGEPDELHQVAGQSSTAAPPRPSSPSSAPTTASTRSWWHPTTPCSSASVTTPRNNGNPQTAARAGHDAAVRQGAAPDARRPGRRRPTRSTPPPTPSSWRSRIYAYGLRNPFRFALDPRSGAPYVGDVGWNDHRGDQHPGAGDQRRLAVLRGDGQDDVLRRTPCARRCTPPARRRCRSGAIAHAGAGAAIVAGMLYTGTSYPATVPRLLLLRRLHPRPALDHGHRRQRPPRRGPPRPAASPGRGRSGGLPPGAQRRRDLRGHPHRQRAATRLQRGEPASGRRLHHVLGRRRRAP